jgi:hypothetical protein
VRVNVYVDGFNLYYGSLKGQLYKWLNLEKMCELLLPNFEVQRVRYFTALVKERPEDTQAPVRQAGEPVSGRDHRLLGSLDQEAGGMVKKQKPHRSGASHPATEATGGMLTG